MAVTLLILNRFSHFFIIRFASKFAAKHLSNIPHTSYASLHYFVKHYCQKMREVAQ